MTSMDVIELTELIHSMKQFVNESEQSYTSDSPLSHAVSAQTLFSADPEVFPKSLGEDFVNVAAISFQSALTIGCEHS